MAEILVGSKLRQAATTNCLEILLIRQACRDILDSEIPALALTLIDYEPYKVKQMTQVITDLALQVRYTHQDEECDRLAINSSDHSYHRR